MTGLTTAQVQASREKYGDNRLPERRRRSLAAAMAENLRDPIIRILLGALALNLCMAFRAFRWYESLGIILSIVLSTLISALSERGSEAAFARIQAEAASTRARVLRNGQQTAVPAAELVVGDAVLLAAGEKVPADGVLAQGSLRVDQSALNGESAETEKRPGALRDGRFSDPAALFRGSVVCAGEGILRVTKVGSATVYGALAGELQTDTRESPLKLRLARLARQISRIGYAGAAVVGAADLVYSVWQASGGRMLSLMALLSSPQLMLARLLHALTLAVTVVVVAVPEGLPMMITVVLSANMRRMLRDQVLVRRLVGIETSGSLGILFCDKTGTLTEGKMAVEAVYTGDGSGFEPDRLPAGLAGAYIRGCTLNTQSVRTREGISGGNATERALLASVGTSSCPGLRREAFEPFDSAKKCSQARVFDEKTGKRFSLWKGAPEVLLPRCAYMLDRAGNRQLLDRPALLQRLRTLTQEGRRVLALAEGAPGTDGLTLVALVSIRDRVRREAAEAVRQLNDAGVRVVMVTGDNGGTAASVARECGLLRAGSLILDSERFAGMSDTEAKRVLGRLGILYRARPDDKTRLVRLAQEAGFVAGMTGDGVNDAPALKNADVGFAMGSGTEVAREAGDITILDDNIASIVRAVLYGRTIFKSIRKFIVFQLTMNLCAVGVSILGPMVGVPSPITVIQMLWINLIMDTLAGLAFAGEPPRAEYMRERPIRRDEPVFTGRMLGEVLVTASFAVGLCVWYLASPFTRAMFGFETRNLVFLSGFFVLFVLCAVVSSLNVRTARLNLLADIRRNPAFLGIMTAVTAVQLAMVYLGGSVFRTAPLNPRELAFLILLSLSVILPETLRKLVLKLAEKRPGAVREEKGQLERAA